MDSTRYIDFEHGDDGQHLLPRHAKLYHCGRVLKELLEAAESMCGLKLINPNFLDEELDPRFTGAITGSLIGILERHGFKLESTEK